jgi:hypothetical protein
MQDHFYNAYAEALRNIIKSMVVRDCPGCQVPFQAKREDHTICEDPSRTIIDNYFPNAWEVLEERDVYELLDEAWGCPSKVELDADLCDYKHELEITVRALLKLEPIC